MTRAFVGIALLAGLVVSVDGQAGARAVARASAPPTTTSRKPVRAKYLGFSIEPGNVCDLVHLASTDPAFVQLFRNLGPGTFRVGGGTGDKKASWSTTGSGTCAFEGVVMTPAIVTSFFAFAQSIGYRVIWEVPLDNGQPAEDAAEAAYASTQPGIYSVEFGNEPDRYYGASSNPQPFIDTWETVYSDYVADGGTAPVAAPDVAKYTAGYYVDPFMAANSAKLSAFTEHYYIDDASQKTPTCPNMLGQLGNLHHILGVIQGQANSYGLPFIMSETNTYALGGRPGVSNAFCSALWAADYLMLGVATGLQGLYFHGAVDYPPGNIGGKLEYYTPINDDGTPAPEYYGLLFYAQMASRGGRLSPITVSPAPAVDAWAIEGTDGRIRVGLINRSATPATVTVQTGQALTEASELSLAAPSDDSLSGVTFGGASVASDGTWTPTPTAVPVAGTGFSVTVPAYTGEVVTGS